MFVRIFQKLVCLFLICQKLVESEDLLQFYRPKPDLPQELNEFLATVQQHKQDFAYIKDYAKKEKAYHEHLKETHSLFDEGGDGETKTVPDHRKNIFQYSSLHNVPKNDIYPFMYQTSIENKYPNERYSKYLHSPIRLRRDLESSYLDRRLKRNSGTLETSDGEIYEYKVKPKSEKNEYLKSSKRGVQINIKDYGNRLDKIENDYSDPKSVVLNIEPIDESGPKNSYFAGSAQDETKGMLPIGSIAEKFSDGEETNNSPQHANDVARHSGVFQGVRNSNHQNEGQQTRDKKADFEKVEGVILDSGNKETLGKTEHINTYKISNKRQLDLEDHGNDGLAFLNLQPLSADTTSVLFEQLEPLDNLVVNLGEDLDQQNKYIEHPDNKLADAQLKSNDLAKDMFLNKLVLEHKEHENKENKRFEEELYGDTYDIDYDDKNEIEEVEIKPSRFVELGRKIKNDAFDVNQKYTNANEKNRLIKLRNKLKTEEKTDYRNNLSGNVREIPTQRRLVLNRHLPFTDFNDLVANPQINREPRRGAHVRKGKKKTEHRHQKKKTRKEKKKKKQKCYTKDTKTNDAIFDDFIPAFHKRSLKAIESMYDAYLGDFGEPDAIEDIEHGEFDKKINADVKEKIDNELEYPLKYEIDSDDKDYNYAVMRSMELTDFNSVQNNGDGRDDFVSVDEKTKKKRPPKGTTKESAKKTRRPATDNKKKVYRSSEGDIRKELSSATHTRGRTITKSKAKPKTVSKTPTGVKHTKSLTEEEKQALLLKFNPGFQRWPRFVLENKKYNKHSGSSSEGEHFSNMYLPQKNNYFVRSSNNDRMKRVINDKKEIFPAKFVHEMDSAEVGQEPIMKKREEAKNMTGTDLNMRDNVTIDPVILATATFPNVVQEVLNNVNDEVFDHKPRTELDMVESTSHSQQIAASPAVTFRFPVDSQYDEEDGCVTYRPVKVTSICEEQLPGQSSSTVTTMLALMNESSYSVNQSKAEYLDLNDILGGNLPKQIVNEIWTEARRSIRKGLRAGPFNLNLELSNYNSSAETSLILSEMTKLIFQLQRSTSCQELPTSLKNYISEITGNPKDDILSKLKEMNDIDFDDYQGAYMFHADQSDKLEGKVEVLKNLLNRYNNLPADCKERAEPVKEYIEKHLGMVNNMLEKGKDVNSSETQRKSKKLRDVNYKRKGKHAKAFKEDDLLREKLIKKQLEEVGLGENQQFSPMFSIDELVENNKNKSKPKTRSSKKRVGKRQTDTSTSTQYGKLADAIRKLNNRREKEHRIQEMYGKKSNVEYEDHDIGKGGFDSALVLDF